MFAIIPYDFAYLITQSAPESSSGLIDMRATYGGMSIAAGLILIVLVRNAKTIRAGLISVFLLMTCMAITRTIGIVVDGQPNEVMYIYLVAEIIAAALSVLLLKKSALNE